MGARNPQSVGGEPALTPPSPTRTAPGSGSCTQQDGWRAAAGALLIKTFILHFFVVCTEPPKACDGPGLGRHGEGGGPAPAPGASGAGIHTNTGGGARAGEECIEAFPGRKGGAETFVLHQLPRGLEPHTGGCGQESGLNPSRGGGARRGGVKWLRWGSPTALQCQPPSSGEPGGSVCVALAQGRANKGATAGRLGGGSRPGGGGGPCARAGRGHRAGGTPGAASAAPQPERGSVPSPSRGLEASWGEQRARPRSRPFFTQICSPRAASAPWCSWTWAAPGGSPEPGSR